MPYPHYDNHDSTSIDTIDNAIVAHTKAKMVRLPLEFLDAWRKWIIAKCGELRGHPPLELMVERPELAQRGDRKFKAIAHGAPSRLQAQFLLDLRPRHCRLVQSLARFLNVNAILQLFQKLIVLDRHDRSYRFLPPMHEYSFPAEGGAV